MLSTKDKCCIFMGNGAFPVKVIVRVCNLNLFGLLPGKVMISWCYVVSQVAVWVRSHERLVQLCNSQTPGQTWSSQTVQFSSFFN